MGEAVIDELISDYESNPDLLEQILRPLTYGLRLGGATPRKIPCNSRGNR